MKSYNISYLKNNLSAILAKLHKSGGAVRILDRDTPIAIIYPYAEQDVDLKLSELEEQGIVTPPTQAIPDTFFNTARSKSVLKIDLAKMLIDDRE
jgi:antitoxin (DNA-binding transcriptional repressor) of toxin-antitoxin stability system